MDPKALGLIAVVVGLGLMPLVSQTLRRRKDQSWHTRRGRREVVACPHLGTATDPLVHQQQPSEDHRCYFEMQRDRIDLAHQQTFCLTRSHTRCPWLAAAPSAARQKGVPLVGRMPGTSSIPVAALRVGARGRTAVVATSSRLFAAGRNMIGSRTGGTTGTAGDAGNLVPSGAAEGAIATPTPESKARRPGLAAGALPLRALTMQALELLGLARQLPGRVAAAIRVATQQSRAASGEMTRQVNSVGGRLWMVTRVVLATARVLALQLAHLMLRAARQAAVYVWKGMWALVRWLTRLLLRLAGMVRRKLPLLAAQLATGSQAGWAWMQARGIPLAIRLGKAAGAQGVTLLLLLVRAGSGGAVIVGGAVLSGTLACWRAMRHGGRRTPRAAEVSAASVPQEMAAAEEPGIPVPAEIVRDTPPVPSASPGGLLARGIAALESGQEDLAYELFVRACRADSREARAWFWRAKTAPSLKEMVECLERASRLAPDNAQIRVNLEWALARQSRELTLETARATAEKPTRDSRPMGLPMPEAEPSSTGRRLLNLVGMTGSTVAALACLSIGMLWIAGALPESIVMSVSPSAAWLAKLMPQLDVAALGGTASLDVLGGYDALSAVPFALGFLALMGAVGLLRREDWARWWAPVVAIASVGLWLNYSSVALPTQALIGLCTLVAVGGPLGTVVSSEE